MEKLTTIWSVKNSDEKFVWCCYLRPAPNNLLCKTVSTTNRVLDAIKHQKWYPRYCYYCYSCIIPRSDIDNCTNWERHIVRNHPDHMAYPGPAPILTARLLEEIESREYDQQEGGLQYTI